jgi:hypothetical protein
LSKNNQPVLWIAASRSILDFKKLRTLEGMNLNQKGFLESLSIIKNQQDHGNIMIAKKQ